MNRLEMLARVFVFEHGSDKVTRSFRIALALIAIGQAFDVVADAARGNFTDVPSGLALAIMFGTFALGGADLRRASPWSYVLWAAAILMLGSFLARLLS
jgi:hypothetical protein